VRAEARTIDEPIGLHKDVQQIEEPMALLDQVVQTTEGRRCGLSRQAIHGKQPAILIGGGGGEVHMRVAGQLPIALGQRRGQPRAQGVEAGRYLHRLLEEAIVTNGVSFLQTIRRA
jgi:hypothetical protein